ncbi:hypothetical protein QS306_14630 [Paraburkholderia bonniea]|uniref:hypothetical protein n=1 Tax=Paraburkholderia bonniea TaxID=2152891 RepID=UPI0012926BAF|nr:hypothetical protein [Paraburkholderia bonniea]WJF92001.1 hypothetical protein QS306_14630 [Paraburkholderia bonniea]WJF95320.1 hypothetical protein QS308_14635 [Paraburkholderia bonniea]
MLSKEQLLAAAATTAECVTVPGVGELRIRVMDGIARDRLQKTLQTQGTSDSVYFSAVIIASVVDGNDDPMFAESDLDELRTRSADVIRAIGLACSKVNALGGESVQDAEKNSGAIPSSSSGTGSHSVSA